MIDKEIESLVKQVMRLPSPIDSNPNANTQANHNRAEDAGDEDVPNEAVRKAFRMWHQLIIIGNGFDLECGLASKFAQFFEPRSKLIDDAEFNADASGVRWGRYLKNANLTAWDVILWQFKGEWWYDIEKCISCWVVPREKKDGGFIDYIGILLNKLRGVQGLDEALLNTDLYPNTIILDSLVSFIRDNVHPRSISRWSKQSVYEYLLEELHLLEKEFAGYLASEIESNRLYKARATSLMGHLIMDRVPFDDAEEFVCSYLSFNYTQPTRMEWMNNTVVFVNVHGTLDGEIVFGIDGKDCMDVDGAVQFTKTYRLMNNGVEALFKNNNRKSSSVMDGDMSVIKFYGHSLSEADYSYFQAVFDAVNLYSGKTQLVFYYRPWKRNDGSTCSNSEARETTMANVVHLLNVYGATMDNKDHGKNLIHKLLLEGRLEVKLLDFDVMAVNFND